MSRVRVLSEIRRLLVGWPILFVAQAEAQLALLHEFAGGASDGANPYAGAPVISGSTLYGMTRDGGAYGRGVVYQIDANGTGFQVLHTFAGSDYRDGEDPYGSLTLVGSTLYGMTARGGSGYGGWGTIFKMNVDGSGFTVLHNFSRSDDGGMPFGSLTLSGTSLYGMAQYGGTTDKGTVFKIDLDGNGFTVLHSFAGGVDDGASPQGDLLLVDSTLYGLTQQGGDSGGGVLFKINTDSSGFGLLHEFSGGVNDGAYPYGSLTLAEGALYGMTYGGGDSSRGTVFKVSIDGTGFTLLHEFAGGADDGRFPFGSLTVSGSMLYGLTYRGGDSDNGTLFEMNAGGAGFTLLHEFAGGANDGALPSGSLTLSDRTLYGMTLAGGDSTFGTVFKFALVPEPPSATVAAAGTLLLVLALRRRTPRRQSDSKAP